MGHFKLIVNDNYESGCRKGKIRYFLGIVPDRAVLADVIFFMNCWSGLNTDLGFGIAESYYELDPIVIVPIRNLQSKIRNHPTPSLHDRILMVGRQPLIYLFVSYISKSDG